MKIVDESVCILFNVEIPIEWNAFTKLIRKINFINIIKGYNVDNVPSDVIAKIRNQYLPNPEFTVDNVKRVSAATSGLLKWVLAVKKIDSLKNS